MSKKPRTIDYDLMVENALKGAVKSALEQVAQHGLPGAHHFYISFRTDFPGVKIPKYLQEEYPDEMTIVLQYEFWDLQVDANGFSVTLCFNDIHECLVIPFDAIESFVDPSVKFGLQFTLPEYELILENIADKGLNLQKNADDKKGSSGKKNKQMSQLKNSEKKDNAPKEQLGENLDSEAPISNVVVLDQFRKKF